MRRTVATLFAVDLETVVVPHSPSTICFKFPSSLASILAGHAVPWWYEANHHFWEQWLLDNYNLHSLGLLHMPIYSYSEAMEQQEVAKWTIWVPHLFFPDSSCKSCLTTLEDQCHCLIPLSWCLLPIRSWQQGVQSGSSWSLHVNGTPNVSLPWWSLLKAKYLLSQNPLLLARWDSNFCCDHKYEYVIYFWLSLFNLILKP